MLVLSRKSEQCLTIGEATVRIVRVRRGNVRIGISAPAHVRILRDDAADTTPPPAALVAQRGQIEDATEAISETIDALCELEGVLEQLGRLCCDRGAILRLARPLERALKWLAVDLAEAAAANRVQS